MFVSDWMTKKVYTLKPDASLYDALGLTKEHLIKYVPILRAGSLAGIISAGDIKDFFLATALKMENCNAGTLSGTTVADIMKKKVVTVGPHTPVEEAAMIMHDNQIGCLPVVEDDRLIGIIADADIYRILVDITGIRNGGHRLCLIIEDRPGSIKDVADIVRHHGFRLQSILTSYEGLEPGLRRLVLRTKGKGNFKGLKADIEKNLAASREIDIMEGL